MSCLYSFPYVYVSSSSFPVLASCIQHVYYCSPDVETSQTTNPIHLDCIQYTYTICRTDLQHKLTRDKLSVLSERSPAWHTLQGQSCGHYIPQTPSYDLEAETQH